MHLYFSLHGRQLCVSAQAFTIHAKAARFQIRRLNRWYLSFSPREPEIAALNLALRLSILPKYDALDVVLLKVITNSLEISRHIQQNANTVFLNYIFFKSIWVCSEMRADCFVSAFLRRTVGIAIGFHEPDIDLIALVHGNPMRPVAGYGVRIAAGNRIRRRNLAAFCIISFVEISAYHRTAAAVDFFGRYAFSAQNPFHAGMNLVVNSDFMMVVKYPLKERRDFLHDIAMQSG